MTSEEAIDLVRQHGVVLESAGGPVVNFAACVVGHDIHGSWWGHPRSQEIFRLTRAVRASEQVLVCRLIAGKVTFVHRELWPALVRLAERIGEPRLTLIHEVHTPSGSHRVVETLFTEWVPSDVLARARDLTAEEALGHLERFIPLEALLEGK